MLMCGDYLDGGAMPDDKSATGNENDKARPVPAPDKALAIPKWPDLASQFASACENRIERLIKDSGRFAPGVRFAEVKSLSLRDAASARAVREAEAEAESRAAAISLARRAGRLFEALYGLVGQDVAARVFDELAECTRARVYQPGPSRDT